MHIYIFIFIDTPIDRLTAAHHTSFTPIKSTATAIEVRPPPQLSKKAWPWTAFTSGTHVSAPYLFMLPTAHALPSAKSSRFCKLHAASLQCMYSARSHCKSNFGDAAIIAAGNLFKLSDQLCWYAAAEAHPRQILLLPAAGSIAASHKAVLMFAT